MDLTWWGVVILGMSLLAGCIAAALLRPDAAESRKLRLLANVGRLTRLPEYVRALRRRMLAAIVAIFLVTVAFAAAVLVTARPAGLPALAGQAATGHPEDIMVCANGPVDAPAVGQTLSYFAEQIPTFGTERIGLSSANRRALPLTRDYEYAAAQFTNYARAADDAELAALVAPVAYADYAPTVEDVLALCLTGFPSFEEPSRQRRSLIYVGPGGLGESPGTPALFSADQVRDLATAAGVQINVLNTGPADPGLDALARDTGGRSDAVAAEVAPQLTEIRAHPPVPGDTEAATAAANVETPDVPLVMALLALTALAVWPVAVRR